MWPCGSSDLGIPVRLHARALAWQSALRYGVHYEVQYSVFNAPCFVP
jgi:hypothetical protein